MMTDFKPFMPNYCFQVEDRVYDITSAHAPEIIRQLQAYVVKSTPEEFERRRRDLELHQFTL